jgi:MFS family permease
VVAISAVQELTAESMQARVMSVLESIGAAMPGIGFALGGFLAALSSPRWTFFMAGCGVIAIVIVMAPLLGRSWLASREPSAVVLDAHDDVVVELLPGQSPGDPATEEGP